MVIGGQAVLVYSEPRLTQDVDIVLGLAPDQVEEVVRLAEQLNLTPDEGALSLARDSYVYPCVDRETGTRVDLVFSSSEYERLAINRAQTRVFGDVGVRFASIEDLLILKVVAGRAIDPVNVRNVLLKNPDVDAASVLHWLEQMKFVVDLPLADTFLRLYRETRP